MNKKFAWSILAGWVIAFLVIYFTREAISLGVFANNGIPDEAFRWDSKVQRALVFTVLLFSVIFFGCTGLLIWITKKIGFSSEQ